MIVSVSGMTVPRNAIMFRQDDVIGEIALDRLSDAALLLDEPIRSLQLPCLVGSRQMRPLAKFP